MQRLSSRQYFGEFVVFPVITISCVLCHAVYGETQYTLTKLGNLGGAVVAEGLDNQGQVVGTAYLPDGSYHAFLWSQTAGMSDLSTLPGDTDSAATGINDAGQIVGTSGGNNPPRGFLWQVGTGMVDIGAATGVSAQPLGITAQGQIVGVASPDPSSNFGFLYTPASGLNAVTISGIPVDDARAINDTGQLAVIPHGSTANTNALLLSTGQAPVEITGPNLTGTEVLAMNDQGTVVGYAHAADTNAYHAYVWNHADGLTDLTPDLKKWDFASAQAINNEGQVVGFESYFDELGIAFLYENGTFYDLSTLVGDSGAGWSGLRAEAINDNGQIAGYGFFNGQQQSFLLTPGTSPNVTATPEPATLSVIALGTIALLRRRRH